VNSIYSNVVQRITLLKGLDRKYMALALSNSALFFRGYGVSIESFNFEMWKALAFALPPLPEQRAIADFLDRETGRIDALIAKKRRLIELLEEKRSALISHAVTKGLDPNVPMKDSGSSFLPDVPAHWATPKLGHLCRGVSDGPHFSPEYVEEGVLFLSARNVKTDRWALGDAKFISEEDHREFCKRVKPERGDVLYTKGGTTGIARTVDFDESFSVWVHIAVLKIRKHLANPFFVSYALNGSVCYGQAGLYTRGATNNDLGLTRMTSIRLALPPMSEQKDIVVYLDRETTRFGGLVDKNREAIDRLQEYRTALISAAVTGKIDVRNTRRSQET